MIILKYIKKMGFKPDNLALMGHPKIPGNPVKKRCPIFEGVNMQSNFVSLVIPGYLPGYPGCVMYHHHP